LHLWVITNQIVEELDIAVFVGIKGFLLPPACLNDRLKVIARVNSQLDIGEKRLC
jgi:hypothetical protein